MGAFSIGYSAEDIAAQLEGRREGLQWRCRCPVHGGHSLMVTEGIDGKVLLHCFGADCKFGEITKALYGNTGLLGNGRSGNALMQADAAIERLHQRIQQARRLYQRADPAVGTVVETYLRSRGITLPVPPVLRFIGWCPHRNQLPFPAMAAPIVNVDNQMIAMHATFLRAGGTGKANLPPHEQREFYGSCRGGVVRLASHKPDDELLIGEGIESVLSAMQLFDLPGWAALSTSGLMALELPSEIRRIVIAVDNDLNGAGQKAAMVARDKWVTESRSVRLKLPPIVGDFNDILRWRA
jgi:putative DNA primase/helicase